MKISVSSAIVTTVIAAISHQASAGEKINIEQSKVDKNALSEMTDKLSLHSDLLLTKHFEKFANALVNDGESLGINVSAYLAANTNNKSDSTARTGNSQLAGCYTNCHNACHSSRSWR
jgi:hypothetical protein